MLKQRIITALVALPVLVVIVWFGQPWFLIFIALWGLIAALEFFNTVKRNNIPVLTLFGAVWTVLFILHPYLHLNFIIPILLTTAIILPLILFLWRHSKEQAFTGWVWTLAGILYIGWLLSHFVLLRNLPDGRNWVLFAMFVTFGSDSAAYFIGRTWGKNHMAPSISPKKTWEGAFAGIGGALLVGLLFLTPMPVKLTVPWWHLPLLSILVSIFGQAGDLVESLFKRNMNVKNSSNIIPGHGGFLDRMDSVVFASVLVYYYVVWVTPLL
jgi:phosphatidate cytidylyltransferase